MATVYITEQMAVTNKATGVTRYYEKYHGEFVRRSKADYFRRRGAAVRLECFHTVRGKRHDREYTTLRMGSKPQ